MLNENYNKIYKIYLFKLNMKKGLYILVGVFTFIFFLSSFVSAEGFCLGSYFSCSNLDENNCYYMQYGAGELCTWDSTDGSCYGNPSCSSLDDTSASLCTLSNTEYYNYCTWEPGCLVNSDCNSNTCVGAGGYCSGSYSTTTKVNKDGTYPSDWVEGTTYFEGCFDCIPPYVYPCEVCSDDGNLGWR